MLIRTVRLNPIPGHSLGSVGLLAGVAFTALVACIDTRSDAAADAGSSAGNGSGGQLGGSAGSSAGGAGPGPLFGTTPVGINGQLSVCGLTLCNQYENPIQLRGMSTHGLQWYGWNKCVSADSLAALANDWGADILRVSMYVQENGYESNPSGFTAQVDTIVEQLVNLGMYAIIDWHMLNPGDPAYNLEQAKTYFTHMAQTHGGKPNVIYEIANEPNGVSWAQIKSYAQEMIALIRQHDPDGIVIVGTPDWSSFGISGDGGPQDISADPLTEANVMYTFHFYAASHGAEYVSALTTAAESLPVFVTEWGTQDYTGDGQSDFVSAQQYLDLLASKKISWTNWNYSDDPRTGAALNPGTCPNGPWSGASLKETGTWVREHIQNPPDDFPTD
jgi:endoglucanase